MSTSQRFFAVSPAEATALVGSADHTVFTTDDSGLDWAEASAERPVRGAFAIVKTTKIADRDPGTQWVGGPGDPWSRPPPLQAPDESRDAYAARHTPTLIAEPPAM